MSIFQQVFACLLPGSPALSAPSSPRASPVFGLRGHKTSELAPTRSPIFGGLASPWSSSRTNSSSSTPAQPEFVDQQLGLGVLIAKAIGLRLRLGLVSRPLKFASELSSHGSTRGVSSVRSPSPFSLDLPTTPEQYESARQHPPAFAQATPPKVSWRLPPSPPVYCAKPVDDIPTPVRDIYLRNANARAHYDKLFAATRYNVSLLSIFDAPLCYEAAPAPSPIDLPLNSFGGQEIDEDPFRRCSIADTQPAWSPRPSAATLALEVPQDAEEDHEDVLNLVEDGAAFDGEFFDPPAPALVVPKHPDGTVYHIVGKLGEGSFGRVLLAATSRGELVALKVIYKPMACAELDKEDLYNERDLMMMAAVENAPFLMHLKAAWEQGDYVYYAMDLCTEDLRGRIRRAARSGQRIPEREVKLLCAEMILGLQDLERLQIVHGDIKPDNILLTRSGRAVITDLGLSQQMKPWDTFAELGLPFQAWPAPKVIGTAGYFAPEALLMRVNRSKGAFTYKVDVFSLGMVFVELMCGLREPLWDTFATAEQVDVASEQWPEHDHETRQAMLMIKDGLKGILDTDAMVADSNARDLLSQMLEAKPGNRPSPEELLRHAYFWDLNIDDVRAGRVPHDHQPRFFNRLDRTVQDASFLTWQYGSRSGTDERYGMPIGPLPGFTWPPLETTGPSA